MKILFVMLTLFCALNSYAQDTKSLFKNPLILGASVSAGYGTKDGGPGAVISRMMNPDAKIINRARSGQTSIQSTRNLDIEKINPSIVLALDLFFWDAAKNRFGKEFEQNTTKLFNSIFEKKIPLIVGKIPMDVQFPEGIKEAGKRKSAKEINDFLEKNCTADNKCLIYDAALCFDEMDSAKYFRDALHTTDEGNLFCANMLVKSGLLKKLR